MSAKLMSAAEIHDFGVEVVFGYLRKEGHEVISVNTTLGMNPQIIATINGALKHVVVRTACYPSKGQIESESVAVQCIEHAKTHKATCYFASVGIANSNGRNDEEMAIPVKGAGFYTAFDGLLLLTDASRVTLWTNL